MKKFQVLKPILEQRSIDNVVEVLKSGWIGLGPKTEEFENKFAEYVGAKYCIGVNSCTSALHLALITIGIGPGDEVITTPNTFVSTNHAILYVGATPVFADIYDTGNLNPADVEKKITAKTKAIMLVHFGGYPADMDEFYRISNQYNIPIIEDCAHATGAKYFGKRIGGIGLIHCFSFHAVKNLPMGDGGAITTNNHVYNEKLRKLRWLGINKTTFDRTVHKESIPLKYLWDYNVDLVGYKYHMNDIAAAIGLGQLAKIDEHNAHRKMVAMTYMDELSDCTGVSYPVYVCNRQSSFHLFPIFVKNRDEVVAKLKSKDISPGVHYKRNDIYPMYKKEELPVAETFYRNEITLPIHLDITKEDAVYIANTLKEIMQCDS